MRNSKPLGVPTASPFASPLLGLSLPCTLRNVIKNPFAHCIRSLTITAREKFLASCIVYTDPCATGLYLSHRHRKLSS